MYALAYLAGLIFAAGGAYAVFKRLQRDVNGIGRKLTGHIADEAKERERNRLRTLLSVPEAKREEMIRDFLEGLR